MSVVFASPDSREFAVAHEDVGARVARLVALYDRCDVRRGERHRPTPDEVAAFEEVLGETNDLSAHARTLTAYLLAFVSTDAGDATAARLLSALETELATLQTLGKRFEAWVSTLGADNLVAASTAASDHAYPLRRAEAAADHQMSEDEEGLASELSLTGSSAWNRLHGDYTSGLTATVDGETLPITVVRSMATHPDARTREAAYRAEVDTWRQAAVPLAAALNAIKGEANVVNRRRGWTDALDPALWANGVDRRTLDAMQEAAVASFPDFRRYLAAKSRLLGHDAALPWWDLFAPVGPATRVGWDTAVDAVERAFSGYSAPLAALVGRAVSERWIDAEPRAGKRGGGFCMPLRDDESRVMINFDESWDGVQTLAHELGHAYHNTALGQRTALQRRTPMALAETASIFCETLMVAAGLEGATDIERLALLNVDLTGSCQVVVDIHSRFLFETAVCSRRETGTISAPELCDLMREAQRATYGDGVDEATYHPYMWALKPHYYSSAFYNWPYTFGLLFGIGLFAQYERDPERFRSGYDDLLSATGLASATDLAAGFGIDIGSTDFWTASLDVVRGRIDEFVRLAALA
jgi:pepF/M3 family oligoendopeptidase